MFAPIRGRRMRLTRTDECGAPVVGPATTGVSKGFVSVGMALQYEDGETIRVTNAGGEYEVNELPDAQLVGVEATIAFTGVQPDYAAMITNLPTVLDFQAAAVGLSADGGVPVVGGYGLEVWTDLAGAGACAGGGRSYGYLLLPYLRGGKIQDFTIENGAASFGVVSTSREGSLWGKGPYNVQESGAAVNGVYPAGKLLEAVGSRNHFKLFQTRIAPPAVFDGLAALAA
jgi:hypothetical protein